MRLSVSLIAGLFFSVGVYAQAERRPLEINSELFDVGLVTGVMSIHDYPGEFLIGANITFKASEDFFLQYNYVQADIGFSAFEDGEAGVILALGDDRTFKHYDLLLGYNLFQGEFFASGSGDAYLSALYLVTGIGDTHIGDEENFSYTLGVGYQIEFFRKIVMRFDYRNYIYSTSIGLGDEEETARSSQFSVGAGYLF